MKHNKRKTIQDPFIIIYHYRRAKKLKKLRDTRKLKIQHLKEVQKMALQQQKQQTSLILNRSMLLQENDWNEAIVFNHNESSYTIEQGYLKSEERHKQYIKAMCWQVLYVVPAVIKRTIFESSFMCFQYSIDSQQKQSVTK